jgi:predicted metal-dependent enzyme (double-stranded beta helix superfamily)
MTLEFEGKERLVARIDAAVSGDCPFEITTCLRRALVECIADPGIVLPDCVFEAIPGHYARREVYTCPRRGFSVIAMTWGPGQGTAIHDHAGMWCVEGVWAGCIEVVSYQLLEQQEELFRFQEVGTVMAGCGSAGSLIPPHEYHTIANPSADRVAVSIHIYRQAMESCNRFLPRDDGWYRREAQTLQLDAA